MPDARNGTVRIYYEVEGAGPPLVLRHGLSDSLEGWREHRSAREWARGQRPIPIDARGQGRSDITEVSR